MDDLVSALIMLMNTPDNFTGPMNLVNPGEFTIRELTDSKSEIVFKPLPQDDPARRRPDISLAREKLGWTPKVKLRDGLVKTIDYFDALLVHSPHRLAQLSN